MGKFESLSVIRDRQVVDPKGEHVGHIRDALCDLREGRIEYVCIALQGESDSVAREAVVPWSAVRIPGSARSPWQVAANRPVLERIAQPIARRK
jgi:sporulation protein YlmC with PRC-barrel domain